MHVILLDEMGFGKVLNQSLHLQICKCVLEFIVDHITTYTINLLCRCRDQLLSLTASSQKCYA